MTPLYQEQNPATTNMFNSNSSNNSNNNNSSSSSSSSSSSQCPMSANIGQNCNSSILNSNSQIAGAPSMPTTDTNVTNYNQSIAQTATTTTLSSKSALPNNNSKLITSSIEPIYSSHHHRHPSETRTTVYAHHLNDTNETSNTDCTNNNNNNRLQSYTTQNSSLPFSIISSTSSTSSSSSSAASEASSISTVSSASSGSSAINSSLVDNRCLSSCLSTASTRSMTSTFEQQQRHLFNLNNTLHNLNNHTNNNNNTNSNNNVAAPKFNKNIHSQADQQLSSSLIDQNNNTGISDDLSTLHNNAKYYQQTNQSGSCSNFQQPSHSQSMQQSAINMPPPPPPSQRQFQQLFAGGMPLIRSTKSMPPSSQQQQSLKLSSANGYNNCNQQQKSDCTAKTDQLEQTLLDIDSFDTDLAGHTNANSILSPFNELTDQIDPSTDNINLNGIAPNKEYLDELANRKSDNTCNQQRSVDNTVALVNSITNSNNNNDEIIVTCNSNNNNNIHADNLTVLNNSNQLIGYYFGNIARETAEWILKSRGCLDGSYLLRSSGLNDDFVLSLCHQQTVLHYKILKTDDGFVTLHGSQLSDEKYLTIDELIDKAEGLAIKPNYAINRQNLDSLILPPTFWGLSVDQIRLAIIIKAKQWGFASQLGVQTTNGDSAIGINNNQLGLSDGQASLAVSGVAVSNNGCLVSSANNNNNNNGICNGNGPNSVSNNGLPLSMGPQSDGCGSTSLGGTAIATTLNNETIRTLIYKSLHEFQPWFHGKISRDEAEFRIETGGYRDGRFLVRERDNSSYAMCISHKKAVKHYRIDVLPTGELAIQDGRRFTSLMALVSHYTLMSDGLWCALTEACQRPLQQQQQQQQQQQPIKYHHNNASYSSSGPPLHNGLASTTAAARLQSVQSNHPASLSNNIYSLGSVGGAAVSGTGLNLNNGCDSVGKQQQQQQLSSLSCFTLPDVQQQQQHAVANGSASTCLHSDPVNVVTVKSNVGPNNLTANSNPLLPNNSKSMLDAYLSQHNSTSSSNNNTINNAINNTASVHHINNGFTTTASTTANANNNNSSTTTTNGAFNQAKNYASDPSNNNNQLANSFKVPIKEWLQSINHKWTRIMAARNQTLNNFIFGHHHHNNSPASATGHRQPHTGHRNQHQRNHHSQYDQQTMGQPQTDIFCACYSCRRSQLNQANNNGLNFVAGANDLAACGSNFNCGQQQQQHHNAMMPILPNGTLMGPNVAGFLSAGPNHHNSIIGSPLFAPKLSLPPLSLLNKVDNSSCNSKTIHRQPQQQPQQTSSFNPYNLNYDLYADNSQSSCNSQQQLLPLTFGPINPANISFESQQQQQQQQQQRHWQASNNQIICSQSTQLPNEPTTTGVAHSANDLAYQQQSRQSLWLDNGHSAADNVARFEPDIPTAGALSSVNHSQTGDNKLLLKRNTITNNPAHRAIICKGGSAYKSSLDDSNLVSMSTRLMAPAAMAKFVQFQNGQCLGTYRDLHSIHRAAAMNHQMNKLANNNPNNKINSGDITGNSMRQRHANNMENNGQQERHHYLMGNGQQTAQQMQTVSCNNQARNKNAIVPQQQQQLHPQQQNNKHIYPRPTDPMFRLDQQQQQQQQQHQQLQQFSEQHDLMDCNSERDDDDLFVNFKYDPKLIKSSSIETLYELGTDRWLSSDQQQQQQQQAINFQLQLINSNNNNNDFGQQTLLMSPEQQQRRLNELMMNSNLLKVSQRAILAQQQPANGQNQQQQYNDNCKHQQAFNMMTMSANSKSKMHDLDELTTSLLAELTQSLRAQVDMKNKRSGLAPTTATNTSSIDQQQRVVEDNQAMDQINDCNSNNTETPMNESTSVINGQQQSGDNNQQHHCNSIELLREFDSIYAQSQLLNCSSHNSIQGYNQQQQQQQHTNDNKSHLNDNDSTFQDNVTVQANGHTTMKHVNQSSTCIGNQQQQQQDGNVKQVRLAQDSNGLDGRCQAAIFLNNNSCMIKSGSDTDVCPSDRQQAKPIGPQLSLGTNTANVSEPSGMVGSACTANRVPLLLDRQLFTLEQKIGSGFFGNCYLASIWPTPQTKVQVAIKVLKEDAIAATKCEILKEAATMTLLDHRHIVKLIGVCEGDPFMLVMELAPLGPLNRYLAQLKEKNTCKNSDSSSTSIYDRQQLEDNNNNHEIILHLMLQVANAMEYLERRNYVHRDLAARNVLLVTERFAKVGDFGMSIALGMGQQYYKAQRATKWPLKWYAPECIYYLKFSTKSDVWSFGVALWEAMAYGRKPYEGMDGKAILQMFRDNKRLPQPNDCPSAIYDLMWNCWSLKPEDRPDFAQIYCQLEDFYEKNYGNKASD